MLRLSYSFRLLLSLVQVVNRAWSGGKEPYCAGLQTDCINGELVSGGLMRAQDCSGSQVGIAVVQVPIALYVCELLDIGGECD